MRARQVICGIPGCKRKHCARGWCDMHYDRWRRYGRVHLVMPQMARRRGGLVARVLKLRDEGLSFGEIGKRLNTTKNVVWGIYYRATVEVAA